MRPFRRLLLLAIVAASALSAQAWADCSSNVLTVTSPFFNYHAGDVITDPNAIALVLTGPYYASVSRCGAAAIPITPTAPIAGSGIDGSANSPAIPVVGGNLGATGLNANFVLLTTAPASPTRLSVDFNNLSGGSVVLVRDDGTATAGTAPTNATLMAFAGGSGTGAQGGSWSSQTFKGRVSVYGPAGAFVSLSQD